MNLKLSRDRCRDAAIVLKKLIGAKGSPLEPAELKTILDALKDLDELIEILNYLGEQTIKKIDSERKTLN